MEIVKCPKCNGTGWIHRKSSIDSMFTESESCYKCNGDKIIIKKD